MIVFTMLRKLATNTVVRILLLLLLTGILVNYVDKSYVIIWTIADLVILCVRKDITANDVRNVMHHPVLVAFITPISEEIVYRLWFPDWLSLRFSDDNVKHISSLLFAICHNVSFKEIAYVSFWLKVIVTFLFGEVLFVLARMRGISYSVLFHCGITLILMRIVSNITASPRYKIALELAPKLVSGEIPWTTLLSLSTPPELKGHRAKGHRTKR
jgi:hypothetical protein